MSRHATYLRRVVSFLSTLMLAVVLVMAALVVCAPSRAGADDAADGRQGSEAAEEASESSLPVGLNADDAREVTVEILASGIDSLDSTLVSFQGEVVGEPVNSTIDGQRWILLETTVNGITDAIQVLMTDDQIALIENYGAYQTVGTTLQVIGIYHVSDPNQAGTLDVTAYAVSVVDPGGTYEEEVDTSYLWVGFVLVGVGVILILLNIILRRRARS